MADRASPRWHFWLVAILGLAWNAFGAWDFVMTNARDPGYIAQIPPEMLQHVDAMPYWALGTWLVGVGGAVLGSLLLLRRSRYAVHAFAASLAGLAVSTAYGLSSHAPGTPSLTIVIWVVAILLLWYTGLMRKARVLR